MAGLGLAACTSTGEPEAPETSAAATSSTPTPTATPTPTETTPPVDKGTPIELTCDELITPQAMYDYNSNFSLTDDYTPAAKTDAATIVDDYQGIACRWVNDSSGETIDVAVAHLEDYTLETLKNGLVKDSTSVPTYSVEGYFEVAGGVGQADAFSDPYWISAESDYFLEPGDAAPIVSTVIDSLG
jgi:hypothetical protein